MLTITNNMKEAPRERPISSGPLGRVRSIYLMNVIYVSAFSCVCADVNGCVACHCVCVWVFWSIINMK